MSFDESPVTTVPIRKILGGSFAVSVATWTMVCLVSFWSTMASVLALPNSTPIDGIVVSVGRFAAIGGVFAIAAITVFRHRATGSVPVAVAIATWATAGVMSAGTYYLMTGGEDSSVWRLAVSAISVTAWCALFTYYFGLFDHLVGTLARLQGAVQAMTESDELAERSLRDLRSQTQRVTFSGTLHIVQELSDQFDATFRAQKPARFADLADLVANYAREQARSDSQSVAAITVVECNQFDDGGSREANSTVIRQEHEPLLVSLFWAPVIVALALASLAYGVSGSLSPGLTLIAFMAACLVLAIFRLIQLRMEHCSTSVLTSITLLAILLASGVGVVVMAATSSLPLWSGRAGPVAPFIGAALLGLFGCALSRRLRAVGKRVAELRSQELLLIDAQLRLDDQIQQERTRAATLLHGPVQGRLAAIALLLRLQADSVTGGVDGQRTLDRCRSLLHQITVDLERLSQGESGSRESLQERLVQLSSRWTGLVNVEFEPSIDEMSALIDDLEVQQCVFNIVEEAINNASMHGHADELIVSTQQKDYGVLLLSIRDNGDGPPESISFGTGYALTMRAARSWALGQAPGGGALLTVELDNLCSPATANVLQLAREENRP